MSRWFGLSKSTNGRCPGGGGLVELVAIFVAGQQIDLLMELSEGNRNEDENERKVWIMNPIEECGNIDAVQAMGNRSADASEFDVGLITGKSTSKNTITYLRKETNVPTYLLASS